ncbi:MAG: YdcF family protein [Lachnospiraceae bacterium]|nr:YdcF family protein [Lachnospiraceae bacterium]
MSGYLSRVFEYAVPCLLFWGVLAVSVTVDRSRFRNCIYLLLAAASTAPLFCVLSGRHALGTARALSILIFAVLLSVPAVLIENGVIMYRKEGRALQNMLSLIMGVLVGVGEFCLFLFFIFPIFWSDRNSEFITTGMKVLLFISLSVVYVSLVFAAFMSYTVLLQLIPRKRDFDYVIIHGSGLLRGREVSKLLADRIDKAIEVYEKDPTPPILIPSGGKGRDEEISEAEAMEKYLTEHGIPKDQIIREDRSTTTRENLVFSKKIIDERDTDPYVALVTSNYHVYRALSLCDDIDLECTGIGAHVARYYWPSALLREFAAIMSKKKNLLIFIAGWLCSVIPAMDAVMWSVIQ